MKDIHGIEVQPVTTKVDISPEAVDLSSTLIEGIANLLSDVEAAYVLKAAIQLHALRSALTASGEALREYGHHKNSCRFVSNVPNPGIRPGSCTCGLEAAMEKANG